MYIKTPCAKFYVSRRLETLPKKYVYSYIPKFDSKYYGSKLMQIYSWTWRPSQSNTMETLWNRAIQ